MDEAILLAHGLNSSLTVICHSNLGGLPPLEIEYSHPIQFVTLFALFDAKSEASFINV
jgi:hypothetical protein